jgi:hypothetical protein
MRFEGTNRGALFLAKRITEELVKKFTKKWLTSKDYKIVAVTKKKGAPKQKRKGRGRRPLAVTPPDIKAKKGTAYYYVEAKGDPASSNALYTVIGQIVTKMAAKTQIEYAIALSPNYRKFLHLFPPEAQRKFNIKVIIPKTQSEKRLPEIIEIPIE